MIQLFRQVAVMRAHEWYFLITCILHKVESCEIQHSHVNDAESKVFDLLFDFGRQEKSNFISILKGNWDRAIHKDHLAVRVCAMFVHVFIIAALDDCECYSVNHVVACCVDEDATSMTINS
eukprot:14003393-Ditylum_brightwellii.AAC.1